MNTSRLNFRVLAILGGAASACVAFAQSGSSAINDPADPFGGIAAFTQQRTDKSAEGVPAGQLVDADMFWRATTLKGAAPTGFDLRGFNLRYANELESTKTRYGATVPVYFGNDSSGTLSDYWMSGVDVNLEQPLGEVLAVGVHGGWLRTMHEARPSAFTLGSKQDNFMGGVYVAARYQAADWVKLGGVVSYDRDFFTGGDAGVLGLGVSATFKLAEKVDLIPRAMYFNNHDLNVSDPESFEVGAAVRYHFSEVWSLGAGYETTLGSSYIKSSHMGFLATTFKF